MATKHVDAPSLSADRVYKESTVVSAEDADESARLRASLET